MSAVVALVTGGSGSGKSAWAEELSCALCPGPKRYLATMRPFGEEAQRRIARHRAMRANKGFDTLECPDGLDGLPISPSDTVLLEDLSNLAANRLFSPQCPERCGEALWAELSALAGRCANLVVVSNEITSDGIEYDPSTQACLALLGGLERKLARRADLVVEVVCGLPLVLKGEIPCSTPS